MFNDRCHARVMWLTKESTSTAQLDSVRGFERNKVLWCVVTLAYLLFVNECDSHLSCLT